MSGKVAAKPSEGARLSKNGRMEISVRKTEKYGNGSHKKPSPDTGKVSAKPTKGASVSRNEKRFHTERH